MKITEADRDAAKILPEKSKMSERAKMSLRKLAEYTRRSAENEIRFVEWWKHQPKTYQLFRDILVAGKYPFPYWRGAEKLAIALSRWPTITCLTDLLFLAMLTPEEENLSNAKWCREYPIESITYSRNKTTYGQRDGLRLRKGRNQSLKFTSNAEKQRAYRQRLLEAGVN